MFPFMLLAMELRLEIYRYHLAISRTPPTEAILNNSLHATWEDLPSPFLQVCQQSRNEMIDLVKTEPSCLRVTSQGMNFDNMAETSFVAHNKTLKVLASLPHLVIDVWPPHPERPIDIFYIWRNIRGLVKQVRKSPMLQRLTIRFVENDSIIWKRIVSDGKYRHGEPTYWLGLKNQRLGSDKTATCSDLVSIIYQFSTIRASKATVELPRSLSFNMADAGDPLRCNAATLAGISFEMSETTRSIVRPPNPSLIGKHCGVPTWARERQDREYRRIRRRLEYETARIARDRLDIVTECGKYKMDAVDYQDFVNVFKPNFKRLKAREGEEAFLGEGRYVQHRRWSWPSPAPPRPDGWRNFDFEEP